MVNPDDIKQIAAKYNTISYETSARTGQGVNEMFLNIAIKIADNM